MERNRTTVRRHTAGEALRHHGARETLIWSNTCGLSSCLSTSQRTRSFVLKAQYVKNVFVPGEGFEPSGTIRGSPPRSCERVQPVRGSPSHASQAGNKKPGLADRARERSCRCNPLPVPVLVWAGLLIETLEALVHPYILPHAEWYPSLDEVVALHSFRFFGSIMIDPY
jgi:hypothetical protein